MEFFGIGLLIAGDLVGCVCHMSFMPSLDAPKVAYRSRMNPSNARLIVFLNIDAMSFGDIVKYML